MAPSAATKPAAAKTAASIQEFNDEQEPGWIFGVVGGSVASVTTGTDDLWDELMLDSGSVVDGMSIRLVFGHQCEQRRQGVSARHSATQNPIAWVKGGSSRIVVSSKDVLSAKSNLMLQDVACRVVSLGKIIESGFTFSFDDDKRYMHKGNQRVEIFRKRVESSCCE